MSPLTQSALSSALDMSCTKSCVDHIQRRASNSPQRRMGQADGSVRVTCVVWCLAVDSGSGSGGMRLPSQPRLRDDTALTLAVEGGRTVTAKPQSVESSAAVRWLARTTV